MNGIDISSWQSGIDLTKVPCDFCIVKATQDTAYINPDFHRAMQQGIAAGKLMGAYHYAGGADPVKEAKHFIKTINDYIGKIILCLDWESSQNASYGHNDSDWCKLFLDYIKQETGVTGFLYISAGLQGKMSKVLQDYYLWAAQYPNYSAEYGYIEHPWNEGAYACEIRQYTSMMYLDGYKSHLDANKAYITASDWAAIAKGNIADVKAEDSVDEIARQVINGKFGNGAARKIALEAKGYDPEVIQKRVNAIMDESRIIALAHRVISGEFGNGNERINKLGKDYQAVQLMVNKILG